MSLRFDMAWNNKATEIWINGWSAMLLGTRYEKMIKTGLEITLIVPWLPITIGSRVIGFLLPCSSGILTIVSLGLYVSFGTYQMITPWQKLSFRRIPACLYLGSQIASLHTDNMMPLAPHVSNFRSDTMNFRGRQLPDQVINLTHSEWSKFTRLTKLTKNIYSSP